MNMYRMKQDHRRWFRIVAVSALWISAGLSVSPSAVHAHSGHSGHSGHSSQIMWVNHFDLLPGGDELKTSYYSTSSGVGSGLTGLVIESTTTGETFEYDGGNKVVHMALDLPKQTKIQGVRVCYELSAPGSYISQIRLAQVQDPPSSALVLLDDGTDWMDLGPVCVDSEMVTPPIKAKSGSVLLSLRLNFGDIDDKIVIRALGLLVK